MPVPTKTTASSVDVNTLYENTISNYISNGYTIISQSENSTEMAYKKRMNVFLIIIMCLFTAFIFIIPLLLIMIFNKGERVFIRITKTGELKIDGYTIENKEKDKKNNARWTKIWCIYPFIQLLLFIAIFNEFVWYAFDYDKNMVMPICVYALTFIITPFVLAKIIKKK